MQTVRLEYREPIQLGTLLDFLGAHAVAGVESYADGTYTTTLIAPGGPAHVSVDGTLTCRLRLTDPSDAAGVITRVRRLLDLDADPFAVDDVLAADPVLAPLVAKRPGLRAPGSLDGYETAIRTIVGQQISVRGARTVLARIVAAHGRPAFGDALLFPRAATLAYADPDTLPMPRARARSVCAVAAAFADGLRLEPGVDLDRTRADLLALPGVGPWTADYLLLRAAGAKDVLLASDLIVRRAAGELGVDLADVRPQWRPYRGYATFHLWAHSYADLWSVPS